MTRGQRTLRTDLYTTVHDGLHAAVGLILSRPGEEATAKTIYKAKNELADEIIYRLRARFRISRVRRTQSELNP